MRTAKIEVDGAVLEVDVADGDGAPLVLLPGWACPRTDWTGVIAGLGPIPVAALDLPGQGGSTDGGRAWSIPAFGAAVAAVIARIGWTDVAVAGHSMGGAVAVEAARTSDRVARVVGVDSLTYPTLYPRQEEPAIAATLAPLEADWDAGMTALVTGLFVDPSNPLVPEIARAMAAMPVGPGLSSLRALMEWDRDAALADVGVPVDVISTAEFADPEAVAALPAGVAVHPYELGGHFFLRDRPAETARLLRELLRR